MQRYLFLLIGALLATAVTASAQPKSLYDSLYAPREITPAVDTTLTQLYKSEFGYSVKLPVKAKHNPIGSSLNLAGESQIANYILSGGCGALKIWNYYETQVVPPSYKVLRGVIFFDKDSTGVNGRIYTRSFILDSVVVRIEALLTTKGQAEYGSRLMAILDSFEPSPDYRKEMALWRFEYGKYHNGAGRDDWEAPGVKAGW